MSGNRRWRFVAALGLIFLVMFIGACKKKAAPPPPPPPPPPAPTAPTVTLQANPSTIERGESTNLSWSSTNATDLDLSGVGSVAPEGSTRVSPSESTTYTITAKGPGGTADASARVTVTVPPPPPPPPPAPTIEELFARYVKDSFFDFDKSDLRPDAREALTADAEFLRAHPEVKILVQGHCDERGSSEYNLGLGQRRADASKDFLVSLGVAADRISTVTLGKESPFCTEHNEDCWQQNRRGHFVMAK